MRPNLITNVDFTDNYDSQLWAENVKNIIIPPAWHEVGATNEPAFQNSWANVGGASDETLAFRLMGRYKLELKGYIDSGTITNGTVVFTLPEGYRPNNTVKITGTFIQGSTYNHYMLEIQTDGDVAIYGVSGVSPALAMHLSVNLDN